MIPNNLQECYDFLDRDWKGLFNQLSLEEVSGYHHSLGRALRNNWGLWRDEEYRKRYDMEKSPIRELLAEMGFTHADDMSSVILESYWHYIRNLPYDFSKKADEFRKFWSKNG